MKALWDQVKAIWSKMDARRRWIFIIAAVLVVGVIILVTVLAGAPKYELLYSRLDEESKAQIIVKLNELKVPFKETPSGGLAVPNATSIRASLLSQGIPSGGSLGWEIFDQSSFSDTDFTNQIKKQRAITGELERTIRKIAGIDGVKVNLHMENEGDYIFAEDKPDATASVLLTLREPGILRQYQVSAIVNMVKGATGIKAENITILDNFANDLTRALDPKYSSAGLGSQEYNTGSNAAERFALTAQYNKEMERKIEAILAKAFTFDKVKAVVNAELDLDYRETKSETYADKGVPRSEQHKGETFEGVGANSVGIPGTDSNITQYKAPDAGTSEYKGEKWEDTINNEISNVKEFIQKYPGTVKHQSVSVLVYKELTPEVEEKVRRLAQLAADYRPDRGDQVTVETFDLTPPPVAKPPTNWGLIIGATLLGLLLITLIVLVIVKEPVPRQVETVKTVRVEGERPEKVIVYRDRPPVQPKPPKPPKSTQKAAETGIGMEVEEEMPIPITGTKIDKIIEDRAQREQAGGGIETPIILEPELTPEEKLRNERLAAIERLAQEKPAEVAALLRAWLAED
ncbi:MAG: flagellar M-ring protein FliF [Firmicutes bacterium]|nr:flagellar M-ring protein FliF [Bacillota bacterium]